MIINRDSLLPHTLFKEELWWDRNHPKVLFTMILNQSKKVYPVKNHLHKIPKAKQKILVLIKEVYLIHLIC